MDISHTEADETRVPVLGALLAYVAILPVVIGAGAAFVLPSDLVVRVTIGWAGAVLCFLGGVRRGLAFRQPGGPTFAELATMFFTFVMGVSGLLSPFPVAALAFLLAGYAEVGITDVLAASRREAPVYFRQLRPVQIAVVLVALAVLLVRVLAE